MQIEVTDLGQVSGVWWARHVERKAAFDLLAELETRVAVAPWDREHNLYREILTSLHSIFDMIRGLSPKYGRRLASVRWGRGVSFGQLAILLANNVIRRFVGKWHPLLLGHEVKRPAAADPREHERAWSRSVEFEAEFIALRSDLAGFAALFRHVTRTRFEIDIIRPSKPGPGGIG